MTKQAGRAAAATKKKKHAQRTPLPDKPVERSAVKVAEQVVAETKAKRTPRWGEVIAQMQEGELSLAEAAKATGNSEDFVKGKFFDITGKKYRAPKGERAPKQASEDDVLLGKKVKELRDTGMAWWAIAHALELPGSADNVAQGKSGASKARSLYKKAFGQLPESRRSLTAKTGGAFGHGPKPKGEKKRNSIRKDPGVASMFEDHTDIDVVEMLKGKRIIWNNTIAGTQEEATIHMKSNVHITEQPSGRAITFREQPGNETPLSHRGLMGMTRTVRLADIVRVAAR
jgi:hypothetical protein